MRLPTGGHYRFRAMTRGARCTYKLPEGRRCQRNGYGSPALCRAHAAVVIAARRTGGAPPPWFSIGVELVDRAASRSQNEILQSYRARVGQWLADAASVVPEVTARTAPPPPPPPPRGEPPQEDPREILGFEPGAPLTRSAVKDRQRKLADMFHPDRGGSKRAMQRVNDAARVLLKEIG